MAHSDSIAGCVLDGYDRNKTVVALLSLWPFKTAVTALLHDQRYFPVERQLFTYVLHLFSLLGSSRDAFGSPMAVQLSAET